MKKSTRQIIIVLAVLGLVGCDQFTKEIAKDRLMGVGTKSYVSDTFRLMYAENTGVFLGLGKNLPRAVRFTLFTLGVATVLALLLANVLRTPAWDAWHGTAITLIVAGGFGNLIDRVFNDGVVIDFMNLGMGGLRTGIFNVADVCITTGVSVFIVSEIIRHFKPSPPGPETTADTGSVGMS